MGFCYSQRTLEQTRNSIQSSIKKSPCWAAVYDFAYEYKKSWAKRGFRCRLLDALLFRPIKKRFSERLEFIFTGGNPLRPESCTFLKLYLGAKLTIVYGSTEAFGCAMSTFDQFDDANTVRLPSSSVLIHHR